MSFNDHGYAERMKGLVYAVPDLDCETLLNLEAAGVSLHHTGDFAEAGDFTVRNIGHMAPLRRRRGQGPHLAKRWEPRGFSRVAAAFSRTKF